MKNMTNILRKKELRDDDSISEIQHTLIAQGLRGEKLRHAIGDNKEYQRIMKRRVSKLVTKNKKVSDKYVMSVNDDFEIMNLIKQLEKKKLSKSDREVIKLLKTQLEHDWRLPLKSFLEKLMRKYQKLTN